MEAAQRLRQLLEESGAVAFGSCRATAVDAGEWKLFEDWLSKGYHAEMAYMERYPEIRRDPRLLLPGARTIISIAYNYRQANPFPQIATYALGQDYHKVLRKRLKRVVAEMKTEYGGEWRICIDSAPILERYWAGKCGIGYRSKEHGNIVVPGYGSMVFLAELITTELIDIPASTMPNAPIEQSKPACPTGALKAGGIVDSRRCINYLTIEHREELDDEQRKFVGEALFGCDICQRACSYNQPPHPPVLPEFRPLQGLDAFLRGENPDFPIHLSPINRSRTLR